MKCIIVCLVLTRTRGNEMATHYFETTGEAYDATQCRDDVASGDVLVVESEFVVGVADTWPVAVTLACGHLHSPSAGFSLAECLAGRAAAGGIEAALALAASLGYPCRA